MVVWVRGSGPPRSYAPDSSTDATGAAVHGERSRGVIRFNVHTSCWPCCWAGWWMQVRLSHTRVSCVDTRAWPISLAASGCRLFQ